MIDDTHAENVDTFYQNVHILHNYPQTYTVEASGRRDVATLVIITGGV